MIVRRIEDQKEQIKKLRSYYCERKRVKRLTGAAAAVCLTLMAAVFIAPSITGDINFLELHYFGATILGPEVGGYVIVGLLAFTLGMLITFIILKYRKLKKLKQETKDMYQKED